ncbi:MAG: hypothetical protein IJS30_00795 [Bacteroidales bacterium]|nr:hypothetical protein [Bacteroidales bacterium]
MKRLIPILVLVVLFASSCSSTYRTMREPNVRFELTGHDYTLSEEAVTGESSVLYVLGIDWAHLFRSKTADVNAPIFGLSETLKTAESYALYDMMQKNPGYDFVMYPQITKTSKGFPVLFKRVNVEVKARLGKLKNADCCKKECKK